MVDVWTLTYAGCEFAFGSLRTTGYGLTADPVVRAVEDSTDDAVRPRGDGVAFGEDRLGATTVSFAMLTDYPSAASPSALQDRFASAWRADVVRKRPGATAELRAPSGRVAFGRPRRPSMFGRAMQLGRSALAAEFDTVDACWYGDEELITVPFVPSVGGGGMVAPFVFPVTTSPEADRSQVLTIGGDLDTPLIVTLKGPLSRGVLRIGPLLLELRDALAYDGVLVADGRSWRRSIRRNGAPAGAAFSRASTWVTELSLPPGRYEVGLRGVSISGTASVDIRHRPAFATF